MTCETCNQAVRLRVRRAKLAERDGHVAVMTGVPMSQRPACGSRWLDMDVAETLDRLLRRLLESGAETSTGHWDELASTAA